LEANTGDFPIPLATAESQGNVDPSSRIGACDPLQKASCKPKQAWLQRLEMCEGWQVELLGRVTVGIPGRSAPCHEAAHRGGEMGKKRKKLRSRGSITAPELEVEEAWAEKCSTCLGSIPGIRFALRPRGSGKGSLARGPD
jgi:hypothetical protein